MVINILEVIIVIFEKYYNLYVQSTRGLLVYFKLGQISWARIHLFNKNGRNYRPKRRIV
jgi:hypothetical protein